MGVESAVAALITLCECGKCRMGNAFELKSYSQVHAVSWNSDGSRVCSANYDTARVWEVSSGQCVHTTGVQSRFALSTRILRLFFILSSSSDMLDIFASGEVCCQLACTRCGLVSHGVPRQSLALLSLSRGM